MFLLETLKPFLVLEMFKPDEIIYATDGSHMLYAQQQTCLQ